MNTVEGKKVEITAAANKVNPVVRDRIAQLVADRKIKHGTLTLKIARQLYPDAKIGNHLVIDRAEFLVVG